MNKPRYAIVRVDCPPKKEIDAQFVCFPKDNNCSGCRYGDTKEQLVRKVAQVIQRGNDFRTLAKEIVEKLQTLRDEIAKQIRDEKMEKIISEAETTKVGE